MDGVQNDEEAFGDEEASLDPEGTWQRMTDNARVSADLRPRSAKAKQEAFAQKRNAHYGNEAEA